MTAKLHSWLVAAALLFAAPLVHAEGGAEGGGATPNPSDPGAGGRRDRIEDRRDLRRDRRDLRQDRRDRRADRRDLRADRRDLRRDRRDA